MERLLIRGAMVIDPSQATERVMDLLVENGRIARAAPGLEAADAAVIDAAGLVCAPGLVDMHVHLRDPGQTHKEDIRSGCRAAAAGGVTTVACMANTSPVTDTPGRVAAIVEKARAADARVAPIAAVTAGMNGDELNDFAALRAAGAVALSDDGRPVECAGLMREAMERAAREGLRILCHCEDLSLTAGGLIHEGEVSRALGVPGVHRAAEEVMTARDIALAAATGLPVHICHVSTRGSVALLRDARRRGVPVTGETAPHYFTFTDESVVGEDGVPDADYRMSPPLRTLDDLNAVIEGLCDGTLSAIATDHAPHTPEEKADFRRAPNGVVGLETSLAAGITALVRTGKLCLRRLISLMSTQPALLLGLPAGTLGIGAPADIVLFDPMEEWTVDPAGLHGKTQNTPFKGLKLTGRVKATILGGKVVYRDEEETP